jgi:hypothetical protein
MQGSLTHLYPSGPERLRFHPGYQGCAYAVDRASSHRRVLSPGIESRYRAAVFDLAQVEQRLIVDFQLPCSDAQ